MAANKKPALDESGLLMLDRVIAATAAFFGSVTTGSEKRSPAAAAMTQSV